MRKICIYIILDIYVLIYKMYVFAVNWPLAIYQPKKVAQLIATACSIVRYDNLDDLKRISRFESEVEPGVNSKANSKLLNSD